MRSRRHTLATAALLLATSGLGCESVPELTFVSDDAGADGAGGDAGPVADAARDAADAASVCTTASPAVGSLCCGTAWCQDCTQANCDECARKGCTGGDLCCPTGGTVTCKDRCR